MKKNFTYIFLLSCLTICSCNKEFIESCPEKESETPIIFGSDEDTKADVTSLSSFYVTATTGNAGSESSVSSISNANFTGSSVYTCDGKYWPITNPYWNFYASNSSMTFSSSGCYLSGVVASSDVVVAYLPKGSVTYKASNKLTFNHILAKVGTITISPDAGCSLSSVSFELYVNKKGDYNIRTGYWSQLGDFSTISTSGSYSYVVPKEYSLWVGYFISKGTTSEFVSTTGSVTITAGKVNNISATVGIDAKPIIYTVTVEDWGSETSNVILN